MLKSAGLSLWRRSPSIILNRYQVSNAKRSFSQISSDAIKAETFEAKRNRLQYQSRKRGMLENCILLSTFSEKYLPKFTEGELDEYDHLLNGPSNDWDLYYWATGVRELPKEYRSEVMDLFINHVKNYEKRPRSLQPKLLTDE